VKFLKSALSIFVMMYGVASAQTEAYKIITCSKPDVIPVKSYLLYDVATKDAALIDAGVSAEVVSAQIETNGLHLQYILITHCHPDHVEGLPALRAKYPAAKVCFTKEEYEDMKSYARWREVFSPALVAAWTKDPAMVKLMDFDYGRIGKPDIFIDDGQEIKFGGLSVTALRTPGHSRGSASFSAGDVVFPGDLILYHSTGYLDYPLCSKEEIVKSIRRLYRTFPEGTKLLSAHGDASTIGYEKANNKNVTPDKVVW